jgi:hypothetical protein
MGAHRHIIDKPITVPAGPDVDGQGWGTR